MDEQTKVLVEILAELKASRELSVQWREETRTATQSSREEARKRFESSQANATVRHEAWIESERERKAKSKIAEKGLWASRVLVYFRILYRALILFLLYAIFVEVSRH
jgi:hypothetical protein